MANYKKSFNFRNGVQVDEDNFVVNANGLVGIGTTIPEGYLLNVYGDTRVTGVVTASQLNVGVATVGFLTATGASVSGVVTAASFSGSAAGLTGIYAIAVDGWYVSTGSISTTSNVGIGTTLPTGTFQVGAAVTINNNGNATYTGIITAAGFTGVGTVSAATFVGSGANITNLNASNIASGTLSNNRLPSDISVSGIITASKFSGPGDAITDLNASVITSGTLSNDRLPSNINVAGIVTASSFVGSGIGLTQLNASNVESGTLSNSRLPANISVSGIVTATTFVGNLTGTATTATALSGSPNIVVGIATASNSVNVGTAGTGFAALSTGNIGVGTAIPTSELQIIKNNNSLVEVISQTNQARISIGQSVGVGRSTAVLRFGSTNKTFDILNNDTGNINLYLHAGPSGIGTGRFDWIYGQTNTELMSLTYGGRLGIGITNPSSNLHVVGTSTVTSNAHFGSNVTVVGNLTAGSITLPSLITNTNIINSSGVSTFFDLNVSDNLLITNNIGIGTTSSITDLDARGKTALFGSIGINTNVVPTESLVVGGYTYSNGVGIGTTTTNAHLGVYGNINVYPPKDGYQSIINVYGGNAIFDNTSTVGIGTTVALAAVDFSNAGYGITNKIASFMIIPRVTASERVGLITQIGAIVYNLTTNKFQGYTGVGWTDFH
ncbi:tail fiber protein [Synechococcus phage S-SRM01]|uniref:Uncharacterized protein n=1 Tax=Synechococcus phage S-SRM01 TaxID=2781608 RepID=A0A879R311_9CAUD|nr:tail fiber protein [Synechococcus phage S-SRM01]QPX48016.1 hypothetical protein [Synechococcus phage S-SRM01]